MSRRTRLKRKGRPTHKARSRHLGKTPVRYRPELAQAGPPSKTILVKNGSAATARDYYRSRLYKGMTIGRLGSDKGPWVIVGKPHKGAFARLLDAQGAVSRMKSAKRTVKKDQVTSSVHTVSGGLPGLGRRS